MARYRLFISAVSSEFERARDLLAAILPFDYGRSLPSNAFGYLFLNHRA